VATLFPCRKPGNLTCHSDTTIERRQGAVQHFLAIIPH
jgi:hypothetical protein